MRSKILMTASAAIFLTVTTIAADAVPTGEEQMKLPRELQIKNRGGSDGAGLCVFASITHSAHWQRERDLEDLFRWMFTRPGGGYPSKVEKIVAEKTQGRVKVIQYEGSDLDVLRLAVKTNRMPAVTYAYSPTGRYGGKKIAHMVSLVGITGTGAAETWQILDNNYPGTVERMSTAEFKRSFTGMGGGWAVILYPPGPPPEPRN